jgi:hypothetical protein
MPILRVPTTIFPGHPISMVVLEECRTHRPLPGRVTPVFVHEIEAKYGGRLALVADGEHVGVQVHVHRGLLRMSPPHTWFASTVAMGGRRDVGTPFAAPAPSMLLHVIGNERVRLTHTMERTAGGGRLAMLSRVEDVSVGADELWALDEEAAAARALVSRVLGQDGMPQRAAADNPSWELQLCHLDEQDASDMSVGDPSAHPHWAAAASMPEDPVELSFWLGCRLPLTTALRVHLLSLQCPLQRMQDVTDALRLLADPSRAIDGGERFARFQLLWHSAEASGCELSTLTPVVHWQGDGAVISHD